MSYENNIENLILRDAFRTDIPLISDLIKELAVYEKLLHIALFSEADLERALFGPKPYAYVVLADYQDKPAGFALFFFNYSTFVGKPGLYLEDLFVRPEYRGYGIGKALLRTLGNIALDNDCGRMEWSVLDWNKPAIDFYLRLGARPMDEWTTFRMDRQTLEEF
ncbi:MAG: GNAT family N-acetyltransferase [Bacteroidota bacterium]